MIQCMNSTAINDLLEMIEKSGIDNSHINFEITESQMSMDSKALRKSINSIKKADELFNRLESLCSNKDLIFRGQRKNYPKMLPVYPVFGS